MNPIFSTWLIIAYGLSFLGYIGRFAEGIPNFGILIGMVLISTAYGFMFLSKVYHRKQSKEGKKEEDKEHDKEKKKHDDKKKDFSKIFTIVGYSLAATFFAAIHLFPKLTFHVRYYDIFGAIGYGTSAIGMTLLPFVLPIGYAVTTLYYVFGSYQKIEEYGWIDRIQLVSRTILALIYGVTAMSYVNMHIL